MVKDPVNNDPNSTVVRLFDEVQKQFVRRSPFPCGRICGFGCHECNISRRIWAKIGVYMVEGRGVVFVHRAGVKYGIKIDASNT